MGGSGSGGPFRRRSPQELAELVRRAEDETSVAAFETKLSEILGDLLSAFNSRDYQLVGERIASIKTVLEGEIEGSIDQRFGGSVAKHTYVDGMSDIDSLLIINKTDLAERQPSEALDRITEILSDRLSNKAAVSHGRMAVTVEYGDGMQIQLLPTLRTKDGKLQVPSSRIEGWSEIDPQRFQQALKRRNEQCGSKLVPTIKLAKAIIGTLPESQRLSGYHVESLAIAIFRDYKGPMATPTMLPTFFEKAKTAVLTPIRDSTGQSIHVDTYLGSEDSEARINVGHILGRLAKRMWNATAAGSTAQWRAIFGLDDE